MRQFYGCKQINNTDEPLESSLYSEHRVFVTRLIARRIDGRHIDDVWQEVALAAQRCTQLPTVPSQLRNWLSAVALRQCALVLRRRQREQAALETVGQRAPAQNNTQPLDDPIHWLLARESREQIRRAMLSLQPETRRMLTRKLVGGATYEQLATEFGITRHAAEYRVGAAKRELRRAMLELGLGEEDL